MCLSSSLALEVPGVRVMETELEVPGLREGVVARYVVSPAVLRCEG
jgi:hypothetical protein